MSPADRSPAERPPANLRPGDPIEDYLDQLYAGLRTTPRQARRIIAEAEDHLREAVAAGIEAGLSEPEAQEVAISSFGSVRAVVRAHARRIPPLAVVGELAMAAWQLTSIAILAVAGSGLVAFVMNQVLGPQFVGGEPAIASRGGLGPCEYWMGIWTHAQNCGQAAMLETSSDAVGLRLLVLIPGLALLGGYLLARRDQRQRGSGAWTRSRTPSSPPSPPACSAGSPWAWPSWALPSRCRSPPTRPRPLSVRGHRHPAGHDRLHARPAPRPAPTRVRLRW